MNLFLYCINNCFYFLKIIVYGISRKLFKKSDVIDSILETKKAIQSYKKVEKVFKLFKTIKKRLLKEFNIENSNKGDNPKLKELKNDILKTIQMYYEEIDYFKSVYKNTGKLSAILDEIRNILNEKIKNN